MRTSKRSCLLMLGFSLFQLMLASFGPAYIAQAASVEGVADVEWHGDAIEVKWNQRLDNDPERELLMRTALKYHTRIVWVNETTNTEFSRRVLLYEISKVNDGRESFDGRSTYNIDDLTIGSYDLEYRLGDKLVYKYYNRSGEPGDLAQSTCDSDEVRFWEGKPVPDGPCGLIVEVTEDDQKLAKNYYPWREGLFDRYMDTLRQFTDEELRALVSSSELEAEQAYREEQDITSTTSGQPTNDEASVGDCVTSKSNVVFRLLLCPVIEFAFHTIEFIYSKVIRNLLIISPLDASPRANEGDQAIYNIWNNFRILANVLFSGVFILATIGQTFSWFLTPYELKKILPRLAVGAIAVQLSWYICGFMLDLFNIIGAGIRGLMLAPVEGLGTGFLFNYENVGKDLLAQLGIGGGTIAIAYWVGGFISGLPLVLFPIIMALIAVFGTLLLRRIIIYLLIFTAPIAFVMWILPNTEGIFRKWWSYFWKALAMYPLVIALIAAGELMAAVINANDGGDSEVAGIWTSIVGMIAVFAPYFAIPLTFQFAGGVLAQLTGSMDRMSKTLDKRLFGDLRDPNSYRARRMKRLRTRRTRKKSRFWDNRAASDRRWVRGGAALAMRFGASTAEQEAELREEAQKFVQLVRSNARDAFMYAVVTGDCTHPVSRDELPSDACNEARSLMDDPNANPYLLEAALVYTLSKAPPGMRINHVREKFFNRHQSKIPGRGYQRRELNRVWDQAVNNGDVQRRHWDQKFLNHETGDIHHIVDSPGGTINSDNLRLGQEFFEQANSQMYGSTFMGQRADYWQAHDKYYNDMLGAMGIDHTSEAWRNMSQAQQSEHASQTWNNLSATRKAELSPLGQQMKNARQRLYSQEMSGLIGSARDAHQGLRGSTAWIQGLDFGNASPDRSSGGHH